MNPVPGVTQSGPGKSFTGAHHTMSEIPLFWRSWSEEQLAAYQQDQGTSNHCAKYAAASALNILFGIVLTGADLTDWVESRPLKGTGRYTIFGNHNGSLVFQTANLVRELGRQAGLPILVKSKIGQVPDLLEGLADENSLALVTLTYFKEKEPVIARGENTSTSLAPDGWIGGHVLIPVAFDPGHHNQAGLSTPWGFLSSWGSTKHIYWMTDEDFRRSWGRLSLFNMVTITRTDI
ncbi:MAG TPA: hypothetical protein ENG59_05540 [Chloroflexi bacterium]|nr:hypothetical protein [Chloroflexota bacterium]